MVFASFVLGIAAFAIFFAASKNDPVWIQGLVTLSSVVTPVLFGTGIATWLIGWWRSSREQADVTAALLRQHYCKRAGV